MNEQEKTIIWLEQHIKEIDLHIERLKDKRQNMLDELIKLTVMQTLNNGIKQ